MKQSTSSSWSAGSAVTSLASRSAGSAPCSEKEAWTHGRGRQARSSRAAAGASPHPHGEAERYVTKAANADGKGVARTGCETKQRQCNAQRACSEKEAWTRGRGRQVQSSRATVGARPHPHGEAERCVPRAARVRCEVVAMARR